MNHLRFICIPLLAASLVAANASTLTFDDLPDSAYTGSAIPNGYGGFNWTNFNYLTTPAFTAGVGPNGYQNGLVSGTNVAFTAYNSAFQPSVMSVSSGTFSLNSADVTAAWNDNLSLEVTGYAGGNLLYDQTYSLSTAGPTLIDFNMQNVDTVEFKSSGGVYHGWAFAGAQAAIDNMVVTQSSTPSPSALLVFVAGAFARRRRR